MVDVLFTVDVEIWTGGWKNIDARFPEAFRRYVYGPTSKGSFGLPYQLGVLNDHGLLGVFFVEPLFATRFGMEPLAEIVGLIREAGHEVQIHLHTEWVDESRTPLLPDVTRKRQFLRQFDLAQQVQLIDAGRRLLAEAGCTEANAFRAGSFGFNLDTLRALAALDIRYDSSFNAAVNGPETGLAGSGWISDPFECEGVLELPITVFRDGTAVFRPAQLAAASFAELRGVLRRASELGRGPVVLLSHNFELLSPSKHRADPVAVNRFRKLCAFLDRSRGDFDVRGFTGPTLSAEHEPQAVLSSPPWRSFARRVEQVYRRRYR